MAPLPGDTAVYEKIIAKLTDHIALHEARGTLMSNEEWQEWRLVKNVLIELEAAKTYSILRLKEN